MRLINSFFVLLLFTFTACQSDNANSSISEELPIEGNQRIIALSGFLTEVLYALGYGDQIVGTDVTSVYPASAAQLPKLGHVTQLNAEAILALKPDLIFVEKAQLNSTSVLDQIKKAGIEIVPVHTSTTLDNALKTTQQLKAKLAILDDTILELTEKIQKDSLQLAALKTSNQPKVLFIYARGSGRLMVSGTNTSAAAIIEKAGGVNAIESFEDFKPLTPEALVEASPDVILMFTSGLTSLDGKAGLAKIPGINQTPAFQNNRIIAMDGHYLTSFGPRAGQAALELATQIHQKEQISAAE